MIAYVCRHQTSSHFGGKPEDTHYYTGTVGPTEQCPGAIDWIGCNTLCAGASESNIC